MMENLKMELKFKGLQKETLTHSNIDNLNITYANLFDDFGGCEGQIIIFYQGNLSNSVEDEMPSLIKSLCFDSIESLLNDKNYVYTYFGQYGYLRLDPEGSQILVSGDDIEKTRYPLKLFVNELFRCGELFLQLLEKIYQNTEIKRKVNEVNPQSQNAASLSVLLKEARDKAFKLLDMEKSK